MAAFDLNDILHFEVRHCERCGPKYGMRAANRELEPDPEEVKTVALVHKLHRKGKSLREKALALTEAGYEPRSGTTWHPNTVRRMLSDLP